MKTTAMTAEERVRYMTQAPVRRLILEMSAPTVILCTMLLQTIGMAHGYQYAGDKLLQYGRWRGKRRWWPPRGRDCF